jgi:pimeloyl-ACP methyl ester carboxylesterase
MSTILDTGHHCVVAGVRLPFNFAPAGSGLPIVLLHGLTDSQRSFDGVFERLAGQHPLLAPTYRGHGEADRPAGDYHPTDLAADVQGMLDVLDIPRAVVVGHSLGAAVALRLAVTAPERVAGLVLVGAFATPATNTAVRELQTMVATLPDPVPSVAAEEFQRATVATFVPESYMETVIAESLKVPARVWRAATEAFAGSDPLEGLSAVRVPTRLVWGDQDAFVPRADQERLLEALPTAQLSIYEGVGHAVHWEQPHRFSADLRAFARAIG